MRQGSNPRRSRGRGPRKPHAGGKQTFDSNGPDIRVRGSAYQVLEKYLAMARDATSAGDRIAAENYLQHAEHYYRILNTNTGEQHGTNGRSRGNGRSEANGFDRNDDDRSDEDRDDEDRNDGERNEAGRSGQGRSSQAQSGEERSEEPSEPGPGRRRSARRAPPQSVRQSAAEEAAAPQGADEPTEGIV